MSKGYVVRGTAPGDVLHEEQRETIGSAVGTWLAMERLGAARVRILAVHADGTETPLPTYEGALAMLDALRGVMLNGADGDLVQAAKDGEEACDDIVRERDILRDEIERLKQREADIIAAVAPVADGGQYRNDIVSAFQRVRRERDEALALLDRVDTNGKSLPSDIREDISATLDRGRKNGWRPPC